MNAIHKKRLLNVARALRESPNPEDFTMTQYGYDCGTPACALGHYAARRDLQRVASLQDNTPYGAWLNLAGYGYQLVDFDSEGIQKHFGIARDECHKLFSSRGCGNAKTAIAAAQYIERFVARKEAAK